MKVFRQFLKPISYLMSTLILFVSCEQYDQNSNENSLSIEDYVAKQIELSNSLLISLENENTKQFEKLTLEKLKNITDFNEVEELLKNIGIKDYQEVYNIFHEINSVTESFINSNSELKNYSENYIKKLIIAEFDKQLFNVENSAFKISDCNADRHTGTLRCIRNFSIGLAAVAAAGFFSLGIGTAIGSVALIATEILCMNDVHSDYENCINQ